MAREPYKKGDRVGAFTVNDIHSLPEYRAEGISLTHPGSGASIYKVACEDRESLFSFAFKTPSRDSTGAAHILEHSVLCGSERFPLRDPFLHMMKGSPHTFLNALTFPDKTVYPAASVVKEDYFHLMDVYGDAVFFPLLKEEVFRQEGHRLETAEGGELLRKGVVYNEMKGSYASRDSLALEWSIRSLFPGTPYSFDSGGDPAEIPRLTYEDFRSFHRRYYHPGNSYIFLYGAVPLEEELEFLDSRFLSRFTADPVTPAGEIPEPRAFERPVVLEKTWPADRDDADSSLLINWRLNEITDQMENLTAQVVEEILLGHDGAPLVKALVESGLGEDISPGTGLELDVRNAVFSVGLRGAVPEDAEAFEKLVFGVLQGLVEEGISQEAVETALEQVEFQNREIAGGGPFGLRLMIHSLRGWLHGADPARTLGFTFWMEKVKEAARKRGYLEGYIQRRLLGNPHRSLLILRPDASMAERQNQEEKRQLREAAEGMDDSDLEGLRRKAAALQGFQEDPESPEALASLPRLSLDSLPAQVQTIERQEAIIQGVPVLFQPSFSNGILYLNMAVNVTSFSEEEKALLPLLSRSLWGVGAGDMSFDRVARGLSRLFGGASCQLDASSLLEASPLEGKEAELFFLRAKFLPRKAQEALDLLLAILEDPRFDNTRRLRDTALEFRNDFRSAIIPSGHHYSTLRACRGTTRALAREEKWHGLSQYYWLHSLLENWSEETALELAGRMKAVARRVFCRRGMSLSVTGSRELLDPFRKTLDAFLEKIPREDCWNGDGPAPVPAPGKGFPDTLQGALDDYCRGKGTAMESFLLQVPSSVGFAAQGFPGYAIDQPGYPAAVLGAQILKTGYLWDTLRARGGAYGAFASQAPLEGIFSLATYRDPSPAVYLRVFRQALANLLENLGEDDLYKAVISTVGRELRPLSPSERGIVGLKRHIYGVTDGIRQGNRERLLGLTVPQVTEVLEQLTEAQTQAQEALLGGEALAGEGALAEEEGASPLQGALPWVIPLS